ncbi:MAG TPA: hypothetical protein VMT53_01205 [Terriglobales bacterium]|nr:hypothetical protein [Terriglobales bacterium]
MRTVRLPESLCAAAEKGWGARFGSIDDLLIFLLQELNQDQGKRMDKAEEQAVEQRLRDLGYI